MKKVQIFQIDAFADTVFRGNPAAVCPLESWLDDSVLQAIAAENNLSETAFFVGRDGRYQLRWFTPRCEVDLCGHATLASAFVLFNELGLTGERVQFDTVSGPLWVVRDGRYLTMDFPSLPLLPCSNPPAALVEGLGAEPAEVFSVETDKNYYAVLENEAAVRSIRPDLAMVESLHPYGVAVTAAGKDVDCVSRYFAPGYGIAEDPVTGSIHCALAPYWGARLNKTRIVARQLSERGGELICENRGGRVHLSGRAVKYLEGAIFIQERH